MLCMRLMNDDDCFVRFDKEFAIDGNLINDKNIAKDAKVLHDAGFSYDDETIDIDPELSDYDLGTIKLKDYTKVHTYKHKPNDKHGLRLGDVFDDIDHFRNALGEVIVEKKTLKLQRCTMSLRDFITNARLMLVYVCGGRYNKR